MNEQRSVYCSISCKNRWGETEAVLHKISMLFIVKQVPVLLGAHFNSQVKVVWCCFLWSFCFDLP